ncbi:hypothetical protein EVAR_63787_1 [Eumeta japonica]|uniref:Uncharacterized protein n=1 Tax=Eumeta variegata TaxID=151549 RepID=A0A4C1ZI97_EUMVA|nr:hypothetical protein EVAR_63787_1 [Eumeta japonica]
MIQSRSTTAPGCQQGSAAGGGAEPLIWRNPDLAQQHTHAPARRAGKAPTTQTLHWNVWVYYALFATYIISETGVDIINERGAGGARGASPRRGVTDKTSVALAQRVITRVFLRLASAGTSLIGLIRWGCGEQDGVAPPHALTPTPHPRETKKNVTHQRTPATSATHIGDRGHIKKRRARTSARIIISLESTVICFNT